MSFVTSPNMSLQIPTVGAEQGPLYANDVNNSLNLIDQHDHSPGRGVQITPAGMNINANLNFNNNNAYNLQSLILFPQASPITTNYAISAAPGGGTGVNDLWYTDGTGVPIQITKSGQVNVVASSIPGETYVAGTFIWTQDQSSLPTTPANFDIGSITLRPNTAATTNGIMISPPSAIASAYDIVLPLLPSVPSFLSIDNLGNITATNPVAPLIPDNAGAQGYFLRQNSIGGETWQTLNSTISTPTSTYSVSNVDDIISCSGASFTVTLPDATLNKGKQFIIQHNGTSITQAYTLATTAGQTVGGIASGSYILQTNQEAVTLESNGVNYLVVSHRTDMPTIVNTTVTLSTGAFGTTTTKEWRLTREGRFLVGELVVVTTGAGTIGSGDYKITMPAGLSIDTTLQPVTTVANASQAKARSTMLSIISIDGATGDFTMNAYMSAFDATTLRIIGAFYNNTASPVATVNLVWGSASIPLNENPILINGWFRIPIAGWQP